MFGTPLSRLTAPTVGAAPRTKQVPARASTTQSVRRYGSCRRLTRSGVFTARPSHSAPQLT
ncbi:hypothetical protein [Streptomyces andamanensis]|uniref:hypothetical protein n=1 Tax=Streptomyces andamanensis TaxID=1565035 RepID=UPI0026C619D7